MKWYRRSIFLLRAFLGQLFADAMDHWLSVRITTVTGEGSPFDDETIRESHMLCLDAEQIDMYSASRVDKGSNDCF